VLPVRYQGYFIQENVSPLEFEWLGKFMVLPDELEHLLGTRNQVAGIVKDGPGRRT
jgi:hypothetical protein